MKDKEMDQVKETLTKVRSQSILASRMREQIGGRSLSGVRSAKLDGMPGSATRKCAGLDARMIREEETERIMRREEARFARMERAAREVMSSMRPELYAFCALYYIGGMSLQDTAKAIDRSIRQCMRYRREIEGDAR